MMINNNHCDYSEKMQRCQEYIEALEEERRKIQVFQRELPLCLELVTQAIEACRQQVSMEYFHGQSECSEQISSEGPVLEEFIPLKRSSYSEDDEQRSEKPKDISCNHRKDSKNSDKSSKKSDWLRSVQLWNQTPDLPIKEDSPRKVSVMEVKRNGTGGAFHPFKREKRLGTPPASMGRSPSLAAPMATVSSSAETGGTSGGGGGGGGGGGCDGSRGKDEDKEGLRKARRCWSPELHRRFIQALQQLGGSHVATPKQIRELMKVDGLTNDEVKSHLQKFRLHTRRPSTSIHNNNHQQSPQFVVVGGIWVPPTEYAAAVAAAAASEEASGHSSPNGIYAPRAPPPPASLPEESASLNPKQQSKQFRSDERCRHTARSNSPATSSSTHTTTASPAL